jgi:hypothetical protein
MKIYFILQFIILFAFVKQVGAVIRGFDDTRSEWNEVVLLHENRSVCTAVIVGPKTVLTHSLCVGPKLGSTALTFLGERYRITLHENPRFDLPEGSAQGVAFGVSDRPFKNALPFFIGDKVKEGDNVAMVGPGYPANRDPSTWKNKYGFSIVSIYDPFYFWTTFAEGAAMYYGDVGGPLLVKEKDLWKVVGITHTGDTKTQTWFVRLDTPRMKNFLQTEVERLGIDVCGINSACLPKVVHSNVITKRGQLKIFVPLDAAT